jgi:hypothetical protein
MCRQRKWSSLIFWPKLQLLQKLFHLFHVWWDMLPIQVWDCVNEKLFISGNLNLGRLKCNIFTLHCSKPRMNSIQCVQRNCNWKSTKNCRIFTVPIAYVVSGLLCEWIRLKGWNFKHGHFNVFLNRLLTFQMIFLKFNISSNWPIFYGQAQLQQMKSGKIK